MVKINKVRIGDAAAILVLLVFILAYTSPILFNINKAFTLFQRIFLVIMLIISAGLIFGRIFRNITRFHCGRLLSRVGIISLAIPLIFPRIRFLFYCCHSARWLLIMALGFYFMSLGQFPCIICAGVHCGMDYMPQFFHRLFSR